MIIMQNWKGLKNINSETQNEDFFFICDLPTFVVLMQYFRFVVSTNYRFPLCVFVRYEPLPVNTHIKSLFLFWSGVF